ncbi:hypothetical protein HID58_002442, partial [Brassica napus]
KTIYKGKNIQNKNYRRRMGSFLEILCAVLIPPVGVFLRFGCGLEFWLSLLLTFFGFIPGMVYAIWVLTK